LGSFGYFSGPLGFENSSFHVLGQVSGVHLSLPLMNSFNKTEAATFPHASYAFLGLSPFSQIN